MKYNLIFYGIGFIILMFTNFWYNLNKFSITLNLLTFFLPDVTTSSEAQANLI